MNYIINNNTIAIIPISINESKIIENNNSFIVKEKTSKIIINSCRYYGSTFTGRKEASKYILNLNKRVPIIIENIKDIIFFSTCSIKLSNCIWINYNYLKKITKIDNKNVLLEFKNERKMSLGMSYYTLDNQLKKCMALKLYLLERKNELNYVKM